MTSGAVAGQERGACTCLEIQGEDPACPRHGNKAVIRELYRLSARTENARAAWVLAEAAQLIEEQAERVDVVSLSPAARDVLMERSRQIAAEGWTAEHDDQHDDGQLARAAAAYAIFAGLPRQFTTLAQSMGRAIPMIWPWDAGWWKPSEQNRRNLVKAGALILAELERLDRRGRS
ncbi:MAG: hypothetical protein BGO82_17115 [Devosia sp. 67-54]|uniref:hypothetical protein n=1 Tax=unclassified Devosia TaxID=196773 RepID=UPI00096969D6|nr:MULTISPECIES: hypothetical protein [unclassified Devosia]MBN9304094.1 hypothetical protein [Devosia sp.]OJX17930.1 MAG: hypothetical protein BGO82_17115 [Devosia sp. 67-54]